MLPKWIAEHFTDGMQDMPIKTDAEVAVSDQHVDGAGPFYCKNHCVGGCAEKNYCFKSLGRIGIHYPRGHYTRKVLFTSSLVVTLIALALQIVIVIGTSSDNNFVQDVNWVSPAQSQIKV